MATLRLLLASRASCLHFFLFYVAVACSSCGMIMHRHPEVLFVCESSRGQNKTKRYCVMLYGRGGTSTLSSS